MPGRQRRVDLIMKSLSWSKAAPVTETAIRAAVGDNAVTRKVVRWLLKQKRGLHRAGTGGRPDPYVYMAFRNLIEKVMRWKSHGRWKSMESTSSNAGSAAAAYYRVWLST